MRRMFIVYILMSESGVALYTGVTNDLCRRLAEHRAGEADGFTARYRVSKLVWFECHSSVRRAIEREKQIKGWRRSRKEALVRSINPGLRDLSGQAAHASAGMEFRVL